MKFINIELQNWDEQKKDCHSYVHNISSCHFYNLKKNFKQCIVMAESSVLIQFNPEIFSACKNDNHLCMLQVKIKFGLKYFNLQSRTLDLGHTTLVPVFLSSNVVL